MRKGMFGVAVLAAALVSAGGATATTPQATNLAITAAFSNAVVAPSTPPSALPVYCPPVAGGCTATPAAQVRWGQPQDLLHRSGLGFGPTAATAVPLNENFVVGTLTHFNFPTNAGTAASSVDLTVNLTAHTATDGDIAFTLPFTLGIDETSNTPPCQYGAPTDVPCPDAIVLPPGGVHTAPATIGTHTYTLTVVGFTTSSDPSTPVSKLITQEDQENQGFLVAKLERNNEAPVTAPDSGTTTSGQSTTIDVLSNDTDADGDPLTASIATGPAGGTATVNADGTITYTAHDTFKGTDTFTYAASDGFTSTEGTVTVDVADATKPTITVPAGGVPAEATGPDGAVVTYAVTANDNVDGALTPDCRPPSGSTFALGTTTVTCTVTDGSNNTATETFDVVVKDTTAPTLSGVPSNATAEARGPGGAPVTYALPTASDAVDPNPTVTCVPASGSTFALGTTTVTCTATDAAGNTSSATFTVTVVPNRAPVCSAVSVRGTGALWPVDHKLVLVALTGATDPDGDTVTYHVDGVTQDEKVTGGGSGKTAFDAQRASSDGSVWLRSERAGTGDGRVYTIAYTVSDGHLSCSSTIDVTVPHDTAHAAVKSAGSYDSFGS